MTREWSTVGVSCRYYQLILLCALHQLGRCIDHGDFRDCLGLLVSLPRDGWSPLCGISTLVSLLRRFTDIIKNEFVLQSEIIAKGI